MNRIFRLKWTPVRQCWQVCSELGSKKKKSSHQTLMISLLTVPFLVSAQENMVLVQDTDIEITTNYQSLNKRINVTNGAKLNLNSSSNSLLTLANGDGITVSDGSLHLNKVNLYLEGTGYLNITGPSSYLYSTGLGGHSKSYTGLGGYFNVSNGGKVIVDGNMDLDYEQGIISDPGSMVTAGRVYLGSNGNSRGDITLSVTNGGVLSASTEIGFGYGIQTSDSTLIASDGGEIHTPLITLSTNSELALGAPAGQQAQAAGIIDAEKINFVYAATANKKITLNHTDNNAVISADISSGSAGLGNINAFAGTTWLTGDNSEFSGKVDICNNAVLGITQNLGTATANITPEAELVLDTKGLTNFGNKLSGWGSITVKSGDVTLSGNNASFNGKFEIAPDATLSVYSQQNLGNSDISNNGILRINSQSSWTFSNPMSGLGILDVNTAGHIFAFRTTTDTLAFYGLLALSDTTFNLRGTNTSAISSASLSAGTGSLINIGTGTQSIKGFAFNGGTVDFGAVAQGAEKTDAQILVTDNLDVSGEGTVRVSTPVDVQGIPQVINSSLPLLELDDGNATIKLAGVTATGTVTGNGGALQLQDASGQVISSDRKQDIIRQGKTVAEGSYDYRLTNGVSNDGLYIGYGLTQLNLLTSGADALELDASGKTGSAADMSARITGAGDLAFNSQKGETVSLSNQNNDYTGVTDIRGGYLLMENDDVLGKTSEIRLAADTMLNMNGHSQTAGKLNGAAGSVLNINDGNLTLTDGGVSAGTLTGSGSLNVRGGELNITGASSTFTASTTIAKDAVVRMNDVSGLGTGNISNIGTLSLTHASGSLGNNLSGTGTVSLLSSDTQLSGNNSGYSGLFVVDESSQLTASATENLGTASVNNSGTLVLNSTTDWQLTNDVSGSGNFRKTGSGSLTVGNNAAWTGQTDIDAGTLILGNADTPVMLASSQVNITENGTLSGYGGVAGNVTNSGTLDLRADAPGNVLTVGGNYTGNNGTLLMNTVLGDDSSATDKLVIKGDASGQTRVAVTNAGGTGAQTLNGIELIHVDGNADSAEFVQAGRIAAGAYDYTLGRGQGSNSGNWYLTSGKNTSEPTPTPDPDSKPEPAPGGYDNDLRPEAGSYTANMAAANTMFVTRLHDRLGPVQYTDAMTGETKNTSMWMRHEGGHNRWHDGTGQLKTQGNRYVVQLGGDIAQWGWGETDRWHLGVMAGYGNEHNNTDSVRTGYRSKGSVNGYSTGLYATWFANDETHNGAYLDTWAQYSWFDNHVKGDGLPGESGKSKGLTASLEAGYTWKAGEFSGSHGSLNEWYVQPQAQVVWMGVKADEHRESNGTRVESTGDGNVRTRLGVKTWIKGHNRMDDGKSREFRPFVEVNWLHNTRDFGTRMNGVTVHQDGARNIGEVKVGVESQINDRLNLWGNMGVQAGDKGYSDTSAMLGVKYTF
ncbi:autotransporter outer membrane beta-barrel domain-containing protein [Escherichia coli]